VYVLQNESVCEREREGEREGERKRERERERVRVSALIASSSTYVLSV